MLSYLTYTIYAAALLSGIGSILLFNKAYRRSGRECFFDYQLFLISFILLIIFSTLSAYLHSLKDLSIVFHRLVLSVQILSCAFVVYTLPRLLLSAFYHASAKSIQYFFTNLSVVTFLMIPPVWFWPSTSAYSFPFIITLLALVIVGSFLLYLLYQNRDEIINSTPLHIKFVMIGFFMACCMIVFAELTLKNLTLPGRPLSLSLIFILWNGLAWLLLSLTQDNSLATTSEIQALKQKYLLTDDEALIVEKMVQGKFNVEIAQELNLPKDFFQHKLNSIFTKVKIKNRIALLEKIHQLR